ncbi:MAG: 2-hydroxyacyl-CoA dehydratase, partial [Clostridia bacterium]|nr:2-hydroxyacyl-CoA dehydratase [Clostridia bacterium]
MNPLESEHVEFTKEMRDQGYTILLPNMLEFHFSLIERVLRLHGYNAVCLKNHGPSVMAEGLKYVHNDTCVPALLVIGQFLDALHSGKYDLHKTALIISQTGGG